MQSNAAVAAEVEIDNIESALAWAIDSQEAEVGLRICGRGWRVWHRSRRLRQGRAWTERTLELGDPTAFREPRMRALEALGGLAYWLEDPTAAVAAYRARLALALDLGLPSEVADAHLDLWFALRSLGDDARSRDELLAARTGYEAIGDDLGVARSRWAEVSLWVMDHRFVEARDALEEVLAVFRQRRDLSYEGLAVGSLAMCAIAVGDLAAADRWFRDALALARWSGVTGVVTSLGIWSQLLDRIGRPQLAARTQGAYEALSETYGVQIPRGLRDIIAFVRSQAGAPATLAPAERQRLVEEGRRMTLDDVVETIGDLSRRESAPAPGPAVARQPARSGRTKAASGAHVTSTRRPTS
jgi:tetratricopeptide (TPR) repeat protein